MENDDVKEHNTLGEDVVEKYLANQIAFKDLNKPYTLVIIFGE